MDLNQIEQFVKKAARNPFRMALVIVLALLTVAAVSFVSQWASTAGERMSGAAAPSAQPADTVSPPHGQPLTESTPPETPDPCEAAAKAARQPTVTMDIALEVLRAAPGGAAEVKVKTAATGELTLGRHPAGSSWTRTWEFGPWSLKGGVDERLFIWWDTLDADTRLTLKVNGVTVFDSECRGNGQSKKSLLATKTPAAFVLENCPIFLEADPSGPEVRIRRR
jgi:hypothetical protein